MSNEHACKVIRDRAISEQRSRRNALPRGCLSPISGVHGCGEFALVGDLLRRAFFRCLELALSLDPRGPLVIADGDA